jgi:ribosome biogenesis GTPase
VRPDADLGPTTTPSSPANTPSPIVCADGQVVSSLSAADIPFALLGCDKQVRRLFAQATHLLVTRGEVGPFSLGRVVSLDRSLPLVRTEQDSLRAQHDVRLAKGSGLLLPAVGDWVVISRPADHDRAIIIEVLPRRCTFSRRDPHDPDGRQVLAANVDVVLVVHPLSADTLDSHRIERELIIAWESGATPTLVLTKADLVSPEHLSAALEAAAVVAPQVHVVVESIISGTGIEEVRDLIPPGTTAVMLGRSGAGKSALINGLLGCEAQETGAVRSTDGAGRHTTVNRSLCAVPNGGVIIDTPGLRTLSLVDAWEGLSAAFPEIVSREGECRFRDCSHTGEPGCAVDSAVKAGEVDVRRLASYVVLRDEMLEMQRHLEHTGRGMGKGSRASGGHARSTR